MSVWNNFRESVAKAAQKTTDKTKSVANMTSLKAKLANLEATVADEYETLGKLYYMQEVGGADNAEAIAAQIKVASDLNRQINAVNAEIREAKKAQAEAKAAAEAEKAARKAAKNGETVEEAAEEEATEEETTEKETADTDAE